MCSAVPVLVSLLLDLNKVNVESVSKVIFGCLKIISGRRLFSGLKW